MDTLENDQHEAFAQQSQGSRASSLTWQASILLAHAFRNTGSVKLEA
jgi:hypothetical protein